MCIKSIKYQTKIIVISIIFGLSVFGFFETQKVFADIFSFTQNKWTTSDSTQISTPLYASSTWGYYSTSSGSIAFTQNNTITLALPTRTKIIFGNELTTSTIDTGVQFSSTTFVGSTSAPINGSTNVVALVDTGVKRDDLVVQDKTGFSFYNLQNNIWQSVPVTFNSVIGDNYPRIIFGDVDEDGDSDALVVPPTFPNAKFFRNIDNIFYQEPVANLGLGVGISSSTEIASLKKTSEFFSFVDANNDKRIDYLVMTDNGINRLAYIRNISTTTDVNFDNSIDDYFYAQSSHMQSPNPNISIDPRMAFIDLNGDNVSDFVLGETPRLSYSPQYQGRLHVYLNNGGTDAPSFNVAPTVFGWNPEYTVSQQGGPKQINNPNYKDFGFIASAAFGDFSGDRISDLVVFKKDINFNSTNDFNFYIGTTTLNSSTGLYEWKGIPSSISPLTFPSAIERISPVLGDFISDQTYLPSGVYISPRIDAGEPVFFRNLNVAVSTPPGTNITLKSRTVTTVGGISTPSIWQNVDVNGSINTTSSAQFIQFKANLTTDNTSKTPSIGSATIQYTTATNGTLISSPINTEQIYSILSTVEWDENTPLGTSVKVSLRSASSTEDLMTAPWEDFTNSTPGCSKASITVTCNNLPLSLRTGSNDQFFQYRISMASDGLNSPEVSRVEINYRANNAPAISSFNVYQVATSTDPDWGKIRVHYNLQDVDTLSNNVEVMLEYNTGTTWNFLSSSTRALSQLHTETFNKEIFPSQIYNPLLKIRITINDGADVNNISSLENTFVLDAKDPTIITSVLDSRIDRLNLIATDDSSELHMRISNYNDFRDAVWEPFATSVTWIATSSIDGREYTYLNIRDSFGNISSKTIEVPAPPIALSATDISDANNGSYRIQLQWASSADANFLNYQVYRKSNALGDTTYHLVSPLITDRAQNSYVDLNLSSSRLYYYRVVIEDIYHNISNYSPEVIEQPDDINGPNIQFENISGNSFENIPIRTIPITISAVHSQPVSVSYSISGGTATQETDYTMSAGTVTIPAGQTSATISFSVLDDLIYENDETFTVTLSSPQESRLGANVLYTHTIKNNDLPPSISFLNTSSTISENGETIIIPVILNTISGATTSVGFSLSGVASLGTDYTITPSGNTLVIPQGATTTSLVVTTINDATYEENKSVIITLLPNSDVTLGSHPSFTFSIIESAPSPFIEFDANESSSNENDGVNNGITLTVSNAFPTDVNVFYTIEGTAHGNFETRTRGDMWTARYSLSNAVVEVGALRRKSGFVTIPTGTTHIALPLTLLNNNSYQGDETIIITLTTPENVPYRIRNTITHTHTIHDDDIPPQVKWNSFVRVLPGIEIISPLHVKVQEGIYGQVNVELRAQLSSALEEIVEIPFILTGANGDSRLVMQQNVIVIPAGFQEGSVIISFLNNGIYEGNKDIQITLQDSVNATTDPLNKVFLITLVDDEEPANITFRSSSQTIQELDSVTIEIPVILSSVRNVESNIPFTIGGTLQSERVEIISESSSISIPQGELNGIIRLLISGDQVYRGNETVVVSLSSSQDVQLGAIAQHTITVEDNDLPPSVVFASESQSVSENSGNISAQVLLSALSLFPVQVSFTVSGTAIQGQDYTIEGSSISIPSGSMNANIPITLINDAVYRGTKTLTLTLSNSDFAQLGLYKTHTITMTDDEVPVDITSPTILNIKTPVVTDVLAIFEWDTDELAIGSVMWGTEPGHLSDIVKENTTITHHFIVLSNLTASTTYYYAFRVIDDAGNSTVTGEQFFNTRTSQGMSQEAYAVLENQYGILQAQYAELVSSTVALTQYEVLQSQYTQISHELQTLQDQIGGGSGTSTSTGAVSEEEFSALQTLADQLQNRLNNAEGSVAELAAMRQSYATLQAQLSAMYLEVEKAKNKIEKDTISPLISDVSVKDVNAFNATISWRTNEPASSFVLYQEASSTTTSTLSAGSPLLVTDHSVSLSRLTTATQYQFSVLSSDNFSNISSSTIQTFKTLFVTETLEDLVKVGDVEQFQEQLGKFIESATPSLVPPVIADVEVMSVGEKDAKIQWKTNIEGSSIVALVPDANYKENTTSTYTSEIGNSEAKEKNHTVLLTGLTSGTKYHFQVKTQTIVGIVGKSSDFTFTTRFEKPDIAVSEVGEKETTVTWITARPTTSYVEYKDIKTGKVTKKGEETPVRSHVMRISNLTPDTSYEIQAYGKDSDGNTLETKQIKFRTKIDKVPPKITNLRIENALIPNRADRLQTIIFWITDEPATSQVFYEEGAGSGAQLNQKTEVIDLLTTNHVVVLNSFKPQMVYRIQALSADHAGNRASSSVRSFLTPQKGESILDIISKNFEQSFGWLKELR